MIDIRKLKELVRLMVANELTELDLRDEQQQVSIKRPDSSSPAAVSGVPGVPMVAAPAAPAVAPAAAPPAAPAAAPAAPAEEEGLVTIESPMVGTFYSKPSPDKPSFISAGDSVTSDSVVCLIEAMKIFNEIKAEQSGTVVKILLNNGDSVEFGQPILLIRPS
jgi:acetyl-CoA carboxylase biotin carboxyl carrier protein